MQSSPFASRHVHATHHFFWRWGFRPFFDCLDRALTAIVARSALGLLWSIVVIMLAPVALIASVCMSFTLPLRRPFVVSRRAVSAGQPTASTSSLKFLSFNVCCLPEVGARYNGLVNMPERARRIGRQLCGTQADFVALQEVFSPEAISALKLGLQGSFPHVIYDVGRYSFKKPLNSGLFFASRFPIVVADFLPYSNACGADALACKGVLGVKLHVGPNSVGYCFNTHLQAGGQRRCRQARQSQLDELHQFTKQFVQRTGGSASTEAILFSVCMGDFNFDNISTDDETERRHPVFTEFADTGRLADGVDHPWAFGTCLLKEHLQQFSSNALTFERMIESEALRAKYLEHAQLADGRTHPAGRRIDLILVANTSAMAVSSSVSLDAAPLVAGLSDHLPVTLILAKT